jgi:hypothetical protein
MATADEQREHSSIPSSYREGEKLLEMAERLDKECEADERAASQRVMLMIGLLGALVGMAFAAWGLITEPFTRVTSTVFLAIYGATVCLWNWQLFGRRRKLFRRNQRALFEIVSMLREVEKAIAEREQVSALERAEFRIRLSRFDVGPDYEHESRLRSLS